MPIGVPFFHPSGKKILFSSNFEAEKGFPFNLYLIDVEGTNLTRITHGETFDAFPFFLMTGNTFCFLQIEIMEEPETPISLLQNGRNKKIPYNVARDFIQIRFKIINSILYGNRNGSNYLLLHN